jgi:hypothetical protein
MKRDNFISSVNQYKATGSKLNTVSFIARSTQIGLKYSYTFTTIFWDSNYKKSFGGILYDFCTNPLKVYEIYKDRANLSNDFHKMCMDMSDQTDIFKDNITKFKEHVS